MKDLSKEVIENVHTIWDYMQMNDKLEKSDLIFVLGSHDTRVAELAADIFLKGFAQKVLFTGGFGKITKDTNNITEAEKFAKIAMEKGVPEESILLEKQSTNSNENIAFSYKLLESLDIKPKSIIVVQKPYMERRAYAMFKKQWPDQSVNIIVTSSKMPFEEYVGNDEEYRDMTLNLLVGDLERIIRLPERGIQIHQEVPANVLNAFEHLKENGYTKQLMTF